MSGFDEALPAFAKLALVHFGDRAFDTAGILRDSQGSLTYIFFEEPNSAARNAFDKDARALLGVYAEDPSATPEEMFDEALAVRSAYLPETVSLTDGAAVNVSVLDRQIIGQDWTRPNFTPASDIPMLTFFSCKGGVGRSTALTIAAADLSARGRNVMIVDFDLEAPGVGSILLDDDAQPEHGVLDFLIENRMTAASDGFLESCIAASPITGGRGLVEVMPALGKNGRLHPSNAIPKLGRAYLSKPSNDGSPISFLNQWRDLIARLAARGKSDVILIDARAGLSESTAPAIIGTGSDVLMFGVDTPQTIDCYRYLLAHLSRLVPTTPDDDDWRLRLRMVHAKAGRTEDAWRPYRDQCYDLFASHLYEESKSDITEAFNFDIDDPVAPHYPWPIPFDAEYNEFNPLRLQTVLEKDFYDRTFGNFTTNVHALLFPGEGDE